MANTDPAHNLRCIVDTFCSEVVTMEQVGCCRRLVFATREIDGEEQFRVVTARLIVTPEVVAGLISMLTAPPQKLGAAAAASEYAVVH